MHKHPADPFELLAMQAAGHPIPPPPAIPGRVYTQRMDPRDDADDFAERWTAESHRHEQGTQWLSRRSAAHTY